jgi:predicted dehydrogenase
MHTVDTMVQIAGLVRSVYAVSERRALDVDLDDTTAMMLRFAGGATGYHATVFATADYCRVTAYGTRGWIEMIDDRDLTVKNLKGSVEKSTFPAPNKERGVLEGFADAVTAGEQFMVPPEHVINSVALLEAIVASALSHREITIA